MDTANSFVMSSYQFVNSLASCYPQSQLNQGPPNPNNNNNNSNVSNANSGGGGGDYSFPPSAYTPNLYPGGSQNHYGPNAGAAQGGYGVQQPNEMVDYAQLQSPQKFLLNQQAAAAAAAAAAASQGQGAQSCKYANEGVVPPSGAAAPPNSAGGRTTSPQDLSTARDISPKLSPNTDGRGSMKGGGGGGGMQGGMNNSSSSNHNNSNSGPLRSPEPDDSDASSESGNEGSGSQSTGGKKNPPHIYPWMKRVHIGQSKLKFITLFFFLLIKLKFLKVLPRAQQCKFCTRKCKYFIYAKIQ